MTAWDGLPENPGEDGVHWIQWPDGAVRAYGWNADARMWEAFGRTLGMTAPQFIGHLTNKPTYLGPCLTPAQVAAKVGAAVTDAYLKGQDRGYQLGLDHFRLNDHAEAMARERASHGADLVALDQALRSLAKEPLTQAGITLSGQRCGCTCHRAGGVLHIVPCCSEAKEPKA